MVNGITHENVDLFLLFEKSNTSTSIPKHFIALIAIRQGPLQNNMEINFLFVQVSFDIVFLQDSEGNNTEQLGPFAFGLVRRNLKE